MRIDVHSHFLPPRYLQEMGSYGAFERVASFSAYGTRLGLMAERQFSDGEAAFIATWLSQMDAGEVDLTVASIGAVQPYFAEVDAGAPAARYANTVLQDAVSLGGGRVAAFGSLPLPHVRATLEEIRFCYDECGFVGINLGCSAAGHPLDDPLFDDVWAALNERHAAVFLHPGSTPEMGVGSLDFGMAPYFGGPTEMALALCRLVLNKVVERHPDIQFIGGVMGGTIPYLGPRFDAQIRDLLPDLYQELGGLMNQLRGLWYDTSFEDPAGIEAVRRTLGVDRLILGSDSPRAPVAEAVEYVQSSQFLDADEKAQILDCNGACALGLSPEFGARTHAHDAG